MESASQLHFGALLRQFRLDAGLTQQQLAERSKLSVEAIGMLERGVRTRPYRETIALLARALDLPPEREALMESASDVARPPRRRARIDGLKSSLLRIVHPGMEGTQRHNLPEQLTSFVGRQREVGEIAALLHEHRLVTIVGAGGVGKTRIALQAGAELLSGYTDGVWVVDLAPLADQTLVGSAILGALQVPSSASALDVVVAYLKTRQLLLIFDNCEHVVARARDAATSIMQTCPFVRVLSTSREALQMPGERVYSLPSLAGPRDSCRIAREALEYGAAALFVDRAVAVDSGFALTDDNVRDVSQICRRLDGIPLAIELAAARVKVLTARQIGQRLDQRFRLLTGGNPRALPRHQTMTASFDWSYELLTPREQRFFEALSIFAGGSTLEAVSEVCSVDGEDDLDAIDLITSLVAKSLLVAESAGSEQRYRFLESSRQYARDKLIARGEREDVARRHARFYAKLAEELESVWDTGPGEAGLYRANAESENWRAALQWTLAERGDVILGQRLAAVDAIVWRSLPQFEGRRWVRAALDLVDECTPERVVARLESAAAQLAHNCGEISESLAAAESALARYRKLGDELGVAHAQRSAAIALGFSRPAEAEVLLQDALGTARARGDLMFCARLLLTMGQIRSISDDFTGARSHFTEALGIAKLLDADFSGAVIELSLAENEFYAGDPAAAVRLLEKALATYRLLGPFAAYYVTITLGSMAMYLFPLKRYDEAEVYANGALKRGRESRMVVVVVMMLQQLALIALTRPRREGRSMRDRHERIARLLGFTQAHLTAMEVYQQYEARHNINAEIAILRDAIGSDEVSRLMGAGATMTEDEAIEQARSLEVQ